MIELLGRLVGRVAFFGSVLFAGLFDAVGALLRACDKFQDAVDDKLNRLWSPPAPTGGQMKLSHPLVGQTVICCTGLDSVGIEVHRIGYVSHARISASGQITLKFHPETGRTKKPLWVQRRQIIATLGAPNGEGR